MKLEQYLETVSEQIRYTKIRSEVTEELKNHILDQAESYEARGAFPEEALERAVREMGDPVETGVALDRIHRPRMNRGIVAAIAVISLLCIAAFYVIDPNIPDSFSWKSQAAYIAFGFLTMLLVYRMDYSILEKHGKKAAFLFLVLMFFGCFVFGTMISGSRRWMTLPFVHTRFSMSEAMLLYVPLFGAVLYSYRGEGYPVLLKLLPWIVIPVYFVWQFPDLSAAFTLFACLLCMTAYTVWKGWYRISKKAVLGILAAVLILTPLLFAGWIYLYGAEYQTARLEAFFTGNEPGYQTILAGKIRESSALLGSSKEAMEMFSSGIAGDYLSDFILVSICTVYGTLGAVAMVGGLGFIIIKAFRISITQKNQLGMIVGCGCGLVFLIKTVLGVLTNLGLIPYTSVSIPFLSYGGSNVIVSYLLLGLVLSVYRYQNILPSRQKTAAEVSG